MRLVRVGYNDTHKQRLTATLSVSMFLLKYLSFTSNNFKKLIQNEIRGIRKINVKVAY